MYSIQAIRLQVEHVLSLFSVVHCTVQNLLTFLGKEGDMDLHVFTTRSFPVVQT